MSDDTPSDDSAADETTGDGFNMKQIAHLGEIMSNHDLSEIRLRRTTDSAEENWVLRRGSQQVIAAAPMAAAPVAPAAAPAPAAPAGGGDAPAAAPAGKTINSPTVGTFYSKPDPDDPPFVKVGDTVSSDTIICMIEAMKVFNKIPADTTGTIARMLVTDGDAVEFGQPLFELE